MSVWDYLNLEQLNARGPQLVELRNTRGGTVIALKKSNDEFQVLSADGYKGTLKVSSDDGRPVLKGKMNKGYLKIMLPVNGLTRLGKEKYQCREMLPIYYGDNEKELIFQYHLLLGDATSTSPQLTSIKK
eukprot:m.137767 g.137767  ORF g.137767 m.137767 type:complete len:130 (-) comp12323_c0_seq1:202-591(-)